MTNMCNCKAEHWQPHAESCPEYKPRPLLTVENIRSGAVPSNAVAVGFLLGEIERLQGEYTAYRADGEPELRAANAEIMRLLCREQQLMDFVRSFISGGVNQDFKPWARELYQKLYSSHEPEKPL